MAWRKRPARPGAQRFFQTATLRKDLVVPVMRQTPRTIALAVAAALLAAAPAQAGEVILVDGDRAVRVNDPAVPTEREVSLGMPVGGPGPIGIAAARSDREARAARRARRAWRLARGEILYQYFPGEGLQLHPLSTFKKANHMYGDCNSGSPSCDEAGLRLLLDEMTELAVRRSSRFIAWEYAFHFGGGSPPWISGLSQGTALQAYARAGTLLQEPGYVETARAGLGAFEARPPRGVRTSGPRGGVHYLEYSFAPRLFIFNGFLQALLGLHDLGKLTGEARATALFQQAEPEARAEVPLSDIGDWSLYSYRGRESSRDYHELLREFLASMCSRRLGTLYCDYAERYRGYQVDPPELTYTGPAGAAG